MFAVVINTLVAVCYHKVLLQVNLDFFDLLLKDDDLRASLDGDTSALISLVLVN